MENKKFFFNGLNELRALAALCVIFNHIESFKDKNGINGLYDNPYVHYFIGKLGKNGVYLFFVLSGFLITFLLLQEKNKYNTILLKKFFMRRVFRIWPLYYMIIFISFILIPFLAYNIDVFQLTPFYYERITDQINYRGKSLLLYLLFLPNFALKSGFMPVGAAQSWSVGVEEQFYIMWPFLILFFKRKHLLSIFTIILFSFVFLHFFKVPYLTEFIKTVPIEFMAIGGLGGYLYYYNYERIMKISQRWIVYAIIVFLIGILLVVPVLPSYVQTVTLGFLFLGLIIVTVNDRNRLVFRNRAFSFLGKISYGIYMYHPFVMFLVFPFAAKFFPPAENQLAFNIAVYIFVFGLAILLSHLSYKYFESYFIKIKDTKFKSL